MLLLLAHVPVIFITNPSQDWCQVIADAAGGDYVMLEPGDYVGPCDIEAKVSEPPGEITVVQSLEPTNPARILHDGVSDYMLSLRGDFGLLLSFSFPEVPEGVTAVRLLEGADLGVRYSSFTGAGIAVQQVGAVDRVGLRDNAYTDYRGIAADVGCGGDCPPEALEVGDNVIDGGQAPMALWADEALIVDNIAIGASGRLFDLHVTGPSAVARNALEADEPIVLNGVAEVTSNILTGAVVLGGGRFAGNTLLGTLDAGGAEVIGNASVGVDLGRGNVDCGEDCFADLGAGDLYPAADGPLIGVGPDGVATDWCGRERGTPSTAGAFEAVGEEGSVGPIRVGYKALLDCRLPTDADGLDPADTAPPLAVEGGADPACGCRIAGGGAGPWVLLALVGIRRRAMRRPQTR